MFLWLIGEIVYAISKFFDELKVKVTKYIEENDKKDGNKPPAVDGNKKEWSLKFESNPYRSKIVYISINLLFTYFILSINIFKDRLMRILLF